MPSTCAARPGRTALLDLFLRYLTSDKISLKCRLLRHALLAIASTRLAQRVGELPFKFRLGVCRVSNFDRILASARRGRTFCAKIECQQAQSISSQAPKVMQQCLRHQDACLSHWLISSCMRPDSRISRFNCQSVFRDCGQRTTRVGISEPSRDAFLHGGRNWHQCRRLRCRASNVRF